MKNEVARAFATIFGACENSLKTYHSAWKSFYCSSIECRSFARFARSGTTIIGVGLLLNIFLFWGCISVISRYLCAIFTCILTNCGKHFNSTAVKMYLHLTMFCNNCCGMCHFDPNLCIKNSISLRNMKNRFIRKFVWHF